MTSSGLWTPNRDLDPTLERGPILVPPLDPISRGTDGVIPLRMVSYHESSGALRYTPTGNPRVHGMMHYTYTIPLE